MPAGKTVSGREGNRYQASTVIDRGLRTHTYIVLVGTVERIHHRRLCCPLLLIHRLAQQMQQLFRLPMQYAKHVVYEVIRHDRQLQQRHKES